MEDSYESAYSPSIHSADEDYPDMDKSFMSTRSCSQMSISSQGSSKDTTEATRKHRKVLDVCKGVFNFQQYATVQAPTKNIAATTSIPAAKSTMPDDAQDTNILIYLGTIQSILNLMTRCAICQIGSLKIIVTGLSYGTASFISIECNNCDSAKGLWSSGSRGRGTITVGDNAIKIRSQLIYASVLSGRLMGNGWTKVHLNHSFLNVPGPISKRNFTLAQADLLLVAKAVAEESMLMAVNHPRGIHSVDSASQYVEVIGTFDGEYQQRSGKSGEGFSRYCFAAAISAETGKVLSYGVACNSCAYCKAMDQCTGEDRSPVQGYDSNRLAGMLSTSRFAVRSVLTFTTGVSDNTKFIGNALERGVIFTAIVSDGDNKTHDVLAKAGIYNDIPDAPTIKRFECITHVAKRMKTNLHKRQDKVLKTARAEKASLTRSYSKKGLSKKEISKKVDLLFKGIILRSSRGRELWDSKHAEEIRHLSLALCGQIASYYRLAVQRNAGDVPSILAAIKSIHLN